MAKDKKPRGKKAKLELKQEENLETSALPTDEADLLSSDNNVEVSSEQPTPSLDDNEFLTDTTNGDEKANLANEESLSDTASGEVETNLANGDEKTNLANEESLSDTAETNLANEESPSDTTSGEVETNLANDESPSDTANGDAEINLENAESQKDATASSGKQDSQDDNVTTSSGEQDSQVDTGIVDSKQDSQDNTGAVDSEQDSQDNIGAVDGEQDSQDNSGDFHGDTGTEEEIKALEESGDETIEPASVPKLEIPPMPAKVDEPEVLWQPKSDIVSPVIQKIDEMASEEIRQIEEELDQLEKQIIEELDDPNSEFIPSTDEEKEVFKDIEKLETDAKVALDEAKTLEKEIPEIIEDQGIVETYVPEYQKVEQGETSEDDEEQEAKPVVEEDDSVQAEIDKAYESGISSDLDEWDRTILLPIFENRLRMSKNSLKYAYSKLKNIIMSYTGITAAFQGAIENYRANRKIILRFAISKETLQLYCSLPVDSLDNAVYPHKKAKGDHAKATPIVVTIDSDVAVRNATEIIAVVMAKASVVEKEHYVPVAYAERYPINPNAVLLGNEHKEPILGQYDDEFDYSPISSEIVDGIIEAKFGKEKVEAKKDLKGREVLDDLRQTATTIKASVALSEPVIYFFDPAVNKDSNVDYLGIQQVLNDKFLGKIIPQMFFAVAEGSDRIEKFNLLALEHAVAQCNSYQDHRFAIAVSCRLLIRDKVFERLVKNAKTEKENLILAFDCALLESLGTLGLERIRTLRNESGVMIMIDNSENAGMKVLTEYDFEYLRFDSRFYAGDSPKQRAHLEMMTGYTKSQNIKATSINVNTLKEAQTMLERGVDIIQGPASGDPKRIITLALKGARKMPVIH